MAASSARDAPQPAALASRGASQPASEACEFTVGTAGVIHCGADPEREHLAGLGVMASGRGRNHAARDVEEAALVRTRTVIRMLQQPARHRDTEGHIYRVKFAFGLTGQEIVLPRRISTRVSRVTTLEWFLPYVAAAVEWPVTHIALHSLGKTVQHVQRTHERTWTLLEELANNARYHGEVIPIAVLLLPPPLLYNDGSCICDFGGCCRLCFVPSNTGCSGCGNNGCCRSGNCGHPCCKKMVGLQDVLHRCDRQGCRPWWCRVTYA